MKKIIEQKLKGSVYSGKKPYAYPRKVEIDTIIDETESVEWNKEEVKRINEACDKDRRDYRQSIKDGLIQFKTDIVDMLINDYKMSGKGAEKLFTKVYNDTRDDGYDVVFDEILEIAEIFVLK